MEQLMGNETIAALQKEALSDPGMKAAVEQVLKNPEMLNEFKNFFKGGSKWKKRRTRRRRGAAPFKPTLKTTIEGPLYEEQLDEMLESGKATKDYFEKRESRTGTFLEMKEQKTILNKQNKALVNEYVKTSEELKKARWGPDKFKLNQKVGFLMNEINNNRIKQEKLDDDISKLQKKGVAALYGGKRKRRQTKRAGMKKSDKDAEEQAVRKEKRKKLKREQESRIRHQQLEKETLEERNARHARLKIGMQATADFGPAVQNLDLKLHNASPEVDKLMEATSRAQSPLGEVLDAAFKQPSKGGKSRRIPRRKRKRKRKRMKTKRRRKKKRRTRRKRR